MRSPGLLGRSILVSVAVAGIAVAATAAVTLNTTRTSLDRQRVRSENVDRSIVDRLVTYGRTSHDWSKAGALVEQLATGGREVTITDLDRTPLISSTTSQQGLDDPSAVIDPLTAVVHAAAAEVPHGYRKPALPAVLLADRPGGQALLDAARNAAYVTVCLQASTGLGNLPHGSSTAIVLESTCSGAPGTGNRHSTALTRLDDAVAADEHRCLDRRGVGSWLVDLSPANESGPSLRTVVLPQHAAAGATAAWQDCATAALTRELAPVVAPSALLYLTETRSTTPTLLDRVGKARFGLALAVVLLAVVGASLLGSRRLLRPVRRMTAATERMAGGDLETRVEVTGGDEIAALATSFNAMAASLSDAEEQRRRMVGDIAHELRTPLANIRGYLEAGHDGVLPRDEAWTASLLEEASLLQHVIDDLQVLAEVDAGRLHVVPDAEDLAATVDTAVQAIRAQADARGITVERVGEASAPHDRIRLRQVVANLLSNSVRHSPDGAVVTVTLGADPATITVRDHGDGIPAEAVAHVFERFYRADPSRSRETGGSGLGLAIVQQVVDQHGGTVSAANAPDGGAVFTVTLPPWPSGSSSAR